MAAVYADAQPEDTEDCHSRGVAPKIDGLPAVTYG